MKNKSIKRKIGGMKKKEGTQKKNTIFNKTKKKVNW